MGSVVKLGLNKNEGFCYFRSSWPCCRRPCPCCVLPPGYPWTWCCCLPWHSPPWTCCPPTCPPWTCCPSSCPPWTCCSPSCSSRTCRTPSRSCCPPCPNCPPCTCRPCRPCIRPSPLMLSLHMLMSLTPTPTELPMT